MSSRPNIVFFHLDNVSHGDIGCYGGAYQLGAATPNVDRFAEDSLMMTNYNVEAQCVPTRSAFVTGRHSVRTGCTTVLPGAGLVAWETTIADSLKKLGYNNAIYGKWHCGEDAGRFPTDKGFDYWYGINGTWDYCMWPEDKWFQEEDLEPEYVLESHGPGDLKEIKVLDTGVKKNIDLEFIEKANKWMEDSVAKSEPFFVYFNHSLLHFPTTPRDEYKNSSKGGEIGDCIQQIDGDFQAVLDKLDELGVAENTIVIFAADNGRDTTFHASNNRGAQGTWRGGYFSTYEGNNRTIGIIRWPGKIKPGKTDEMVHVVDWFPTLMNMIGYEEGVPTDRVIDGVDQSAFMTGEQETSNRNHFHMFFDQQYVGMRYKNFKVLTHIVEDGAAPIQKLATPHLINLSVNPDEDTPYNYEEPHSWVLFKIFSKKTAEWRASLAKDSVPFAAPLDYNPYEQDSA